MMINQQTIEEFIVQVTKLIPEDMNQLRKDIENNLRAAAKAGFRKMDLVTREEFDIQTEVLKKSRKLVDELTIRINELEQQLKQK